MSDEEFKEYAIREISKTGASVIGGAAVGGMIGGPVGAIAGVLVGQRLRKLPIWALIELKNYLIDRS